MSAQVPLPRFFDSLTSRPEPVPVPPGTRISFYACGITPYAPAHIGHARSYVVFDLMRATLEAFGYPVDLVRNITDIDDKIIATSARDGVSWSDLSWGLSAETDQLLTHLGVETLEAPKASEHIEQMQALIRRLFEKSVAYVGETGDVLFDTQAFSGTPLRPGRTEGDLHSRVSSEGKRHPSDFVLWKPAKPGEPSWPSPWGDGRPGWHLECSAMVQSRFGDTLHYHGGGIDLCFPHHQAEILQSEAAFGRPLAHRWVHHGSVRDKDGRKMSKSAGTALSLRDALDEAIAVAGTGGGLLLRLALLSALWTQPLDWSSQLLQQTDARLRRWLFSIAAEDLATELDPPPPDHPVRLALGDNLNTPRAFAVLDKLGSKGASASEAILQGLALLGLPASELSPWVAPKDVPLPEAIQQLVARREEARREKNFARADGIREELGARGFDVEDGADGPKVHRRR